MPEEEPCHERVITGDGALEQLRLWRMVKRGCRVATSTEPFLYLNRSLLASEKLG